MARRGVEKSTDRYKILAEKVKDPTLSLDELVSILRQKDLPKEFFDEVASNKRWTNEYTVKMELVRNPSTPPYISIRFVKFLYKPDLINVIQDVGIPINIRQVAEELLQTRLRTMPLGDRMAMARTANPTLCRILLRDPHIMVFEVVLKNRYLREVDLYPYLNDKRISSERLLAVCANQKWFQRYGVRKAIASNPKTPIYLAERLMMGLLKQDLEEIYHNQALPKITRDNAKEIILDRLLSLPPIEAELVAESGDKLSLEAMVRYPNQRVQLRVLRNSNMDKRMLFRLIDHINNGEILDQLPLITSWGADEDVIDYIRHRKEDLEKG